jgi:hypothetical protein
VIAEHLPNPRQHGAVLETIDERRLLKRLKTLCETCKFANPKQYKLHRLLQVPEFTELAETLLKVTERAGFEPAERVMRSHAFQACSLGHSDTSPHKMLDK